MASHAIEQGQSLDLALNLIPSLPRPMLARFVERAIERMDIEDADPDLEEDDFLEDDFDNEREAISTFGAQSDPIHN